MVKEIFIVLRTALNHRKFKRLAEALDLPRYAAVGIAECLWHLTATQAPQGDIGKLSDAEIAEGVFWPKRSAGKLIQALTSSEVSLLDRCKCHRLRVHDWNCHADQSVKKTLSKNRKSFCSCYSPDPRSGTVPGQDRNGSGLPEPEPEPEPVIETPGVVGTPPRPDADAARDELRAALTDLRSRSAQFGTLADQAILDYPRFHSSGGGICRIDSCTNPGLLRATAAKVRAYGKPPKRPSNGAPAWDRGIDHGVADEDLAWDPRLGPRPEPIHQLPESTGNQDQHAPTERPS
jgi:hypothetical protein